MGTRDVIFFASCWDEFFLTFTALDNDGINFITVRDFFKTQKFKYFQKLIFGRGHIDISFREVIKTLGKEKEYVLGYDTKKDNDVTGSIVLKFSLTGSGSELCPVCGLFTGEMDTIAYINNKFHACCTKCCVCNVALTTNECGGHVTEDFVCLQPHHRDRFYCRTHFQASGIDSSEMVRVLGSDLRESSGGWIAGNAYPGDFFVFCWFRSF